MLNHRARWIKRMNKMARIKINNNCIDISGRLKYINPIACLYTITSSESKTT